MKAFVISGYTTDLSHQIGILSYPGKRVFHLVLPEEGLRITPFRGQLLISSEIDQLLEWYGRPNNPLGHYTGEELELREPLVGFIRELLRTHGQVAHQLADEQSELAKYFAEPFSRHIPKESVAVSD